MTKPHTGVSPKGMAARARLVPYEEVRNRILADPEVRIEYDKLKIKREIARTLFDARKKARLTQEQVAKLAGTRQSVIARLEGGSGGMPGLALLERVAQALGLRLSLKLEPKKVA